MNILAGITSLPLMIVIMIVSIVAIVKGGDYFVDAASWIAEVSGVPKLIVGATVVSLATTLPEMLVSVFSAIEARTSGDIAFIDMSIGNAVGSVTANIGLILGIALVCMPCVIRRKDYMFKGIMMLLASAVIVVAGLSSDIGLVPCLFLLAIFAVVQFDNIRQAVLGVRAEKGGESAALEKPTGKLIALNVVKFLGGAFLIAAGAEFLVESASFVAGAIGISERVISITILAVGTSLPELVTTITSISKKQFSLSAGNIIGANIMDITLIMPICALVSGKALPVSENVRMADIPASLILGSIALIPSLITKKFARWQGVLLLVLYVAYLVISAAVLT